MARLLSTTKRLGGDYMSPEEIKKSYESLKVRAIRLQSKVQHHKDTALELKAQYNSITKQLSLDRSSLLIQETSIKVSY